MRVTVTGLVLAMLAVGTGATAKTEPSALSETVETLASPAFEGRGPGTPGEAKTIAYLIARLKALKLQPAGDKGQWVQKVPLVHTLLAPGATVTIGGTALQPGTDIVMTTVRAAPQIAIAKAPLVFVGYGVNAAERGWDDFKGVDLTGKVAVFLVNDPDFEATAGEDAFGKFGGRRMTYYGRWTYKFEEAARRGAIAALIVHDTGGAGYGWNTVGANNGGENYDIVRGPADPRVALQGWIAHDYADALFRRAGKDLPALRIAARSAAFKPVDLGVALDAEIVVKIDRIDSANVLAKIPGKRYPAETIQFGAHWDAYGRNPKTGEIRPGANDDGLGVAGVIELARQFAAGPRPDRTLVFAFWTAEERGLLGSEYYATHPLFPLGTTVANLTLDIMQTAGPAKDVILVGAGQSSLETDLAAAATAQGRTITPETFSERGLFYRADHFSLVRRGVPALQLMALGGASDLVAGGRAAGQAWLDAYMTCYHQACDAWSADWKLDGAAADIDLFHAMGLKLANSREWPSWQAGSEFTAIRDRTKAMRAR